MLQAPSRLGLALLAALALNAPRPAHAAEDPKAKARALLKQGNDKYKAGDIQGALDTFQKAYAAYPSAKILFNVGQAAKELGKEAVAADAFYDFLQGASADTSISDKMVEDARAALRDVDQLVILVRVELSPKDAKLELDGHPVPTNFHLSRREDPGKEHVLKASLEGYRPAQLSLTLGDAMKWAGQKTPVHIELQRVENGNTAPTTVLVPVQIPAQTPPPVVITEPQKAPPPNVTPTPTQLAQNEQPAKPETAAVSTPAPGPNHTPAYVAFGVAGALAAGATAFGIMALSQKGGLTCGTTDNPCVGKDFTTAESAHNKARTADLLWLGAAIAGGTGAVLWFVAPGESGSGGEVGLMGRF